MCIGPCPLYEGVAIEDEPAKIHLRPGQESPLHNASFGPASVAPDIGISLLINNITIHCVALGTGLGLC